MLIITEYLFIVLDHVSQLFDNGTQKVRPLNNLATSQLDSNDRRYLLDVVRQRKEKFSPFYSMFTFVND